MFGQLRLLVHSPMIMKMDCWVVAIALCIHCVAQQPSADPNAWVRHAIENELKAEQQDTSHWKFRLKDQKENGSFEVDEVVETPQGDLKKPLIINGRNFSATESEQRMEKMLHDHDALEKSLKEKNEDAAKSQQLLKMLPDAFLFKYGERTGDVVQLDFSPNPKFKPPTREAEVFHAMAGRIWFNIKGPRLREISGHLIHEVKFGEGILGHLDPGGDFDVKQAEVAPGFWEVTVLNVNMKGKALFFKTIDVQQKTLRSAFTKVPDQMSLQQAETILKRNSSAR